MEKFVKKRKKYFSKVQEMEILKDFDQRLICTSLAEQVFTCSRLIYSTPASKGAEGCLSCQVKPLSQKWHEIRKNPQDLR